MDWLLLFECCLRFLRRFGSFVTGLTIARSAFLRFCEYRAVPGGFPVTRGDTGGQTGLIGFRFTPGGLNCFEFFFRFPQRLLNQPDHKFPLR